MVKKLELVGQTFGRLTALAEAPTRYNASGRPLRFLLCRCACGGEREYAVQNLRSGISTSCGCARTVHGHRPQGDRSPTYSTWSAMLQRCNNPKHSAYPRYGGKGVTVCDEWANSFEAFLHDMGERPPGQTLDRIDGSKGYQKANCRWATPRQQYENKPNARDERGRFIT